MTSDTVWPQRRATIALAVLVGLSVAAWVVVNTDACRTWPLVGCAMLLVGFVKAWLVGYEFMGIRLAPAALRLALLAWVAATAVGLIVILLG